MRFLRVPGIVGLKGIQSCFPEDVVRRQGSEQKPAHKACLEHDFLVLVLEVRAAVLAATAAVACNHHWEKLASGCDYCYSAASCF